MAVNGGRDFEAQKSASIHHKKSTQYGFGGLINAFWSKLLHLNKKNIHISLASANWCMCVHKSGFEEESYIHLGWLEGE